MKWVSLVYKRWTQDQLRLQNNKHTESATCSCCTNLFLFAVFFLFLQSSTDCQILFGIILFFRSIKYRFYRLKSRFKSPSDCDVTRCAARDVRTKPGIRGPGRELKHEAAFR